jgi:hypothetical protein
MPANGCRLDSELIQRTVDALNNALNHEQQEPIKQYMESHLSWTTQPLQLLFNAGSVVPGILRDPSIHDATTTASLVQAILPDLLVKATVESELYYAICEHDGCNALVRLRPHNVYISFQETGHVPDWKIMSVFSSNTTLELDNYDIWRKSPQDALAVYRKTTQTRKEDMGDGDSDYWNQYDNTENESVQQPQAVHLDDDEYYQKYDTVETAIQGDGVNKQQEDNPLRCHVDETVRSLYKLCSASGISRDEFDTMVLATLRST